MAGRRARTFLLAIGLLIVTSGCSVAVGCKTYTLLEPPTFALKIDDSACAAPPAVIPEVPMVVLVPVLGFAMVLVGRRVGGRRRSTVEP